MNNRKHKTMEFYDHVMTRYLQSFTFTRSGQVALNIMLNAGYVFLVSWISQNCFRKAQISDKFDYRSRRGTWHWLSTVSK